jgi:hypothetical protein
MRFESADGREPIGDSAVADEGPTSPLRIRGVQPEAPDMTPLAYKTLLPAIAIQLCVLIGSPAESEDVPSNAPARDPQWRTQIAAAVEGTFADETPPASSGDLAVPRGLLTGSSQSPDAPPPYDEPLRSILHDDDPPFQTADEPLLDEDGSSRDEDPRGRSRIALGESLHGTLRAKNGAAILGLVIGF